MNRFRSWWKRLWCNHRHGTIGGSPWVALLTKLFSGEISIDEYRKAKVPAHRSECCRCGKVWVRW